MHKTITALALALAATTGQAADWGFDDWDTDGDRLVNEHEFSMGLREQGVFGVADVDDDDLMSPEEWDDIQLKADVDFDEWDTAGDRTLSEDEFSGGLFGYLDTDDDRIVSEEEWETAAE